MPQITVEDLRIQLNLKHGDGIPTARLLLTSPQVQALPTSQHAYDLAGDIELPGAGTLKLGGNWDLKSHQWKLAGNLRDVSADQNLLQLAQATNPEIEQQLQQIDTAVQNSLPPAQIRAWSIIGRIVDRDQRRCSDDSLVRWMWIFTSRVDRTCPYRISNFALK